MIGILTLVSSDNCGSLLQAYALKYALNNILEIPAELINFAPKNARKMYRIFHPYILKKPKQTLTTFRKWSLLVEQKNDYNDFRIQKLSLQSPILKTRKQLWEFCKSLDCVVVGSDQVWNVNMFDFDDAYFLSGFSGSKISYAASLGGAEKIIVPKRLFIFRDDIEKMNYISVREPQGKKILSLLTNRDITVCVDPTLLVPVDVWDQLAAEQIPQEDYIFFYSYNYGDNVLNSLVQSSAKHLGLPVYVINASRWIEKSPSQFDFHLCDKGGPLAFLSLMKHAKYVFVQSLHGAIFATIFKTNFWFLNNRTDDIMDQRSENILKLLDVRDRTIRPNNVNEISIESPLIYKDNVFLKEQVVNSINYLRESLS